MRRHYMRIRSVKDSKSFDKYLKSKSTEELIFCSSTVDENTNYSHLNREITFELPNEFLNTFKDLLIDPKTFEQEFKQNLEEHFNIRFPTILSRFIIQKKNFLLSKIYIVIFYLIHILKKKLSINLNLLY